MASSSKTLNKFIIEALQKEHRDIFEELSKKYEEINKENKENLEKHDEQSQEDKSKTDLMPVLQKLMAEKLKTEEELKQTKELYTLAKIEFNDFLKKSEQKIAEAKINTTKKFATEILSIMGSIDLAKKSCQHDTNMFIGIEMLEKQFLEILKHFKIERINIEIGQAFDEKLCEALDKEKGGQNNTISKIFSFPFTIEGQLLLPGKVIVFE